MGTRPRLTDVPIAPSNHTVNYCNTWTFFLTLGAYSAECLWSGTRRRQREVTMASDSNDLFIVDDDAMMRDALSVVFA